ncbi:MAG: type VI secretion system tip protein VgrG [Polyangiaceae bacterium]|nr:type VI secretion system tip protein VgrG [Polyangiaceae bacterium]MCW5791902.1 type VI secretion system tip protein VgrG [Polyangiaceae bacterium]
MNDDNLRVRLYSSALSAPVDLLTLSGEEHVSQLSAFKLTFAAEAGLDLAALVDPDARAAVLFLRGTELLRVMHGRLIVAESYLEKERSVPTASVQFAPRAARLAMHRRTETYTGTLDEILRAVLDRSGFVDEHDYELRLSTAYPSREFVLQYQEDDLAFISRLCEHWGVYFFFEHGQRDVMVFCDDVQSVRDVATSPQDQEPKPGSPQNPASQGTTQVPFQLVSDQSSAKRLAILAFGEKRRAVTGVVVVHDYNYRLPSLPLNTTVPVTDPPEGIQVEYGLHYKTPEEGRLFATRRAEALLATQHTHRGESNTPVLRAGGSVELTHPDDGDRKLLVTGVSHEASTAGYSNHFSALPAGVSYRAPIATPKPRVAGVVTGVVIGPQADDPLIDEEGRYQVALLFDAGPGAARQTRPIRMLQPTAGPDYGMHFPLKPGTEVAVAFVNGDPDRPLIVGAVPNPITPSPVRGERQNRRRNLLKSFSGIEIEMDDDA